MHLIDSGGVYGAERVILNLSERLLLGSMFRPVVGCLTASDDEKSDLFDAARALGIDAMRLSVSNEMLAIHLPRLASIFSKEGVTLIHAHGYKAAVFGYLCRAFGGPPVLSTCHLWFEPERGPLKMRVMVWVEKLIYRKVRHVVAVSEDIRKTLVCSGVAPEKVSVIPNGVDIAEVVVGNERRSELRSSLGVSGHDFCIFNAGRLTRQKSQDQLVLLAQRLKDRGIRFKVLIVGSGELEGELRMQITSHGVADCVSLLGFREDVAELMKVSDVFVLPSLNEGMSMSLLEAVSARLPVIATPVGDVRKLVTDGVSGKLVPVGDLDALEEAVLWVFDHRKSAIEMANSARDALVRTYSSDRMAVEYEHMYERVLAGEG